MEAALLLDGEPPTDAAGRRGGMSSFRALSPPLLFSAKAGDFENIKSARPGDFLPGACGGRNLSPRHGGFCGALRGLSALRLASRPVLPCCAMGSDALRARAVPLGRGVKIEIDVHKTAVRQPKAARDCAHAGKAQLFVKSYGRSIGADHRVELQPREPVGAQLAEAVPHQRLPDAPGRAREDATA